MKRSSIAMAVITAGLFGLALYHNCKAQPSADELACDQLQPHIAAFRALQEARHRRAGELISATVATPGERFAGVALGQPIAPETLARVQVTTTPSVQEPFAIWVHESGGVATTIEVELGRYESAPCVAEPDDPCACEFEHDDRALCDDVAQRLEVSWGAPARTGGARTWTAPGGPRATLTGCSLVFE